MKSIKIIFLLPFLFIFSEGYTQAVISFNTTNHDFNQVAEGTVATYEFKFKNEGNAPLVISKVQASCGCTTPFWTKEPVKPGEEGVITASYNSKGRPGTFNKSITITSNATSPTTRLYIKGTVAPVSDAGAVYSKEALANSPKVSLERNIVNLGKVEKDRAVPVKVTLQNTGKRNLIISDLLTACNCIQLGAESSSLIQPGKSGTLHLIYRAKEIGKQAETASILTNDLNMPETKIIIHAEVVESLSNSSILKERESGFSF